MRDIAVAVTCYNNEDEVLTFAKDLSHQTSRDRIQLLVTCNACNDFSAFQKRLLSESPTALVYNPNTNLGYLHGCLYGVEKSQRKYSWVMICNTDIEFKDDDYFDKLLTTVPEEVWCIGTDIVLKANGVHQNPFILNRPSKRKFNLWKFVFSSYPLFYLYFILHDIKPEVKTSIEVNSGFVYAIHGSCFLLKDECVQKIIQENPGIFMYGEELLIAEITRESGKKCYLDMDACVIHNENQVTGKIGNRRKQKWFKQSINYLFHKHLNNSRWENE